MRGTNLTYLNNDPDVLERRYGGGCLTLFGLPFLLIGLILLTIGIADIVMDFMDKDEIVLFLLGLSFFLAGAALVFWRGGWTINRRQGVMKKWWGFAAAAWTKEYPLSSLEWVRLSHRKTLDDRPWPRYFVHIGGQRLGAPIEMEYFSNRRGCEEAHNFAKMLSDFLNLPLEELPNDGRTL